MTLRNRIATLAIALAMLVATPRAMAAATLYEPEQDIVKLKDGRELKGTIVKEQNGYIWLDLGVGPEMFISPADIEEIVRDSDEPIPSGDEGFAVNRKVQGLTNANVIQWRRHCVETQIHCFRVWIGKIGCRICCIQFRDFRSKIRLAGCNHGSAHRIVGAEHIGCLGDRRRFAPIVITAGQDDIPADIPFGQNIRAGSNWLAGVFHRCF